MKTLNIIVKSMCLLLSIFLLTGCGNMLGGLTGGGTGGLGSITGLMGGGGGMGNMLGGLTGGSGGMGNMLGGLTGGSGGMGNMLGGLTGGSGGMGNMLGGLTGGSGGMGGLTGLMGGGTGGLGSITGLMGGGMLGGLTGSGNTTSSDDEDSEETTPTVQTTTTTSTNANSGTSNFTAMLNYYSEDITIGDVIEKMKTSPFLAYKQARIDKMNELFGEVTVSELKELTQDCPVVLKMQTLSGTITVGEVIDDIKNTGYLENLKNIVGDVTVAELIGETESPFLTNIKQQYGSLTISAAIDTISSLLDSYRALYADMTLSELREKIKNSSWGQKMQEEHAGLTLGELLDHIGYTNYRQCLDKIQTLFGDVKLVEIRKLIKGVFKNSAVLKKLRKLYCENITVEDIVQSIKNHPLLLKAKELYGDRTVATLIGETKWPFLCVIKELYGQLTVEELIDKMQCCPILVKSEELIGDKTIAEVAPHCCSSKYNTLKDCGNFKDLTVGEFIDKVKDPQRAEQKKKMAETFKELFGDVKVSELKELAEDCPIVVKIDAISEQITMGEVITCAKNSQAIVKLQEMIGDVTIGELIGDTDNVQLTQMKRLFGNTRLSTMMNLANKMSIWDTMQQSYGQMTLCEFKEKMQSSSSKQKNPDLTIAELMDKMADSGDHSDKIKVLFGDVKVSEMIDLGLQMLKDFAPVIKKAEKIACTTITVEDIVESMKKNPLLVESAELYPNASVAELTPDTGDKPLALVFNAVYGELTVSEFADNVNDSPVLATVEELYGDKTIAEMMPFVTYAYAGDKTTTPAVSKTTEKSNANAQTKAATASGTTNTTANPLGIFLGGKTGGIGSLFGGLMGGNGGNSGIGSLFSRFMGSNRSVSSNTTSSTSNKSASGISSLFSRLMGSRTTTQTAPKAASNSKNTIEASALGPEWQESPAYGTELPTIAVWQGTTSSGNTTNNEKETSNSSGILTTSNTSSGLTGSSNTTDFGYLLGISPGSGTGNGIGSSSGQTQSTNNTILLSKTKELKEDQPVMVNLDNIRLPLVKAYGGSINTYGGLTQGTPGVIDAIVRGMGENNTTSISINDIAAHQFLGIENPHFTDTQEYSGFLPNGRGHLQTDKQNNLCAIYYVAPELPSANRVLMAVNPGGSITGFGKMITYAYYDPQKLYLQIDFYPGGMGNILGGIIGVAGGSGSTDGILGGLRGGMNNLSASSITQNSSNTTAANARSNTIVSGASKSSANTKSTPKVNTTSSKNTSAATKTSGTSNAGTKMSGGFNILGLALGGLTGGTGAANIFAGMLGGTPIDANSPIEPDTPTITLSPLYGGQTLSLTTEEAKRWQSAGIGWSDTFVSGFGTKMTADFDPCKPGLETKYNLFSPLILDTDRSGAIALDGGTIPFDIAPHIAGLETIPVPAPGKDMFLVWDKAGTETIEGTAREYKEGEIVDITELFGPADYTRSDFSVLAYTDDGFTKLRKLCDIDNDGDVDKQDTALSAEVSAKLKLWSPLSGQLILFKDTDIVIDIRAGSYERHPSDVEGWAVEYKMKDNQDRLVGYQWLTSKTGSLLCVDVLLAVQ